jgi:hypothetical protein
MANVKDVVSTNADLVNYLAVVELQMTFSLCCNKILIILILKQN